MAAGSRFEQYEGAALIAWLMDPMRLRAMFPWWEDFEREQEEVREYFRTCAKTSHFSRMKNFSKGGGFFLQDRIPSRLDQIFLKLDPELDGSNPKKRAKLLHDYPVFDVRVRGK